MNRIIVSRHGESVESAERVENGDPRTDKGLTEEGKKQARKLGRDISEEPIDLCVVSEFPRTQETARIALERREVPWVVDGDLNDLRYGELEGVGKERYRAWARDHSLATPLPGRAGSTLPAACVRPWKRFWHAPSSARWSSPTSF